MAGARVVYRLGGQLRSFGIASLISWRGRWYVVHFGAVLRNAAVGLVDQPSRARRPRAARRVLTADGRAPTGADPAGRAAHQIGG